jgi:hypothetical protein
MLRALLQDDRPEGYIAMRVYEQRATRNIKAHLIQD